MNKDEKLLNLYYQDFSVQTFENVVLLFISVGVAYFACHNLDTKSKIMMIVFFALVDALLLVYQYFISRVYFNLKSDIKYKRIKTATAKITEVKKEIVLTKLDGSCIDWFYGEGVTRYKVHYIDENQNKDFFRVPLHFLNAIALTNQIGENTVTFSYYEKSKVIIFFHEEAPKKTKRIPRKYTLNHLIKCPEQK